MAHVTSMMQAKATITQLEEHRKNGVWSWYCFHGSMSALGVLNMLLAHHAVQGISDVARAWQLVPAIGIIITVCVTMKQRRNHVHLWLYCMVTSSAYVVITSVVLAAWHSRHSVRG